jgi:hypothetical protein
MSPPGGKAAARVRERRDHTRSRRSRRGAVDGPSGRRSGGRVYRHVGARAPAHAEHARNGGVGDDYRHRRHILSDGGLGAALVRKTEDPTVDELRTLLAMQLVLACAFVLGVAAVGSQAGTVGTVTAVMACSLPLMALRAPHAITLERALKYRPIAATEFADSLVFYGWAIATVDLGWVSSVSLRQQSRVPSPVRC